MNEETRQAFANLIQLMNDQHERLLSRVNSLSHDFQNTKGFIIDDTLTLGKRVSYLEARLDEIEKKRS